jgi:hypothetical protein
VVTEDVARARIVATIPDRMLSAEAYAEAAFLPQVMLADGGGRKRKPPGRVPGVPRVSRS